MKTQRFSVLLIIINITLLSVFFARSGQESKSEISQVIRARVIELVDEHGKTRAQFKVESTGETVLRMRDSSGIIRVKLSAEENGSGFLLLDDETNPAVHFLAMKNGTSMVLSDKNGRKKELRP